MPTSSAEASEPLHRPREVDPDGWSGRPCPRVEGGAAAAHGLGQRGERLDDRRAREERDGSADVRAGALVEEHRRGRREAVDVAVLREEAVDHQPVAQHAEAALGRAGLLRQAAASSRRGRSP